MLGADGLTVSAKKLFVRIVLGLLGICVGLTSLGLVGSRNWPEVLGGAVLAWGVSIMVWAASAYGRDRDEIATDLRRNAELDLLHARLNQIAARVGARPLILDHELEHFVGYRMQRLAHFAGLDEFHGAAHTTPDAHLFWDAEALGYSESNATDEGTG